MNRIKALPTLHARPLDGHKGMFGRVLVIGGQQTMVGAPVLSGTSALRCGAGLVQLAVPRGILASALCITPELIGLALDGTKSRPGLREAADSADAIVIGPGLGESAAAHARLGEMVRLKKPMVLDADALNMLAAGKRWPAKFEAHAVLTPHPGEMKRLGTLIGRHAVPSDEPGRIDIATAAARAFGQVVVLKGNRTVVTNGKCTYVNVTGDSSLSKAGTGDVLSGIIATFLAQGMGTFESACAAVWIHGRAGEIAGWTFGRRSVLARDVINSLPAALAEYEKKTLV